MSDGVVGSVENALRNSGANIPKEYIDMASRVMTQTPRIRKDPVTSLLQIDRKSSTVVVDKKSGKSKEAMTQFTDIFNRSLKDRGRRI